MEKGVLDEERDKIRELHQRQQDSLKSLQALENKFCNIAIDDGETLRGSSIASRVPTLELMTNAPVIELPPPEKISKPQPNTITIELSTADDSDTSDSDATISGDDNEEQISTEELEKAADHVKKLLKRITMLQKSFATDKKKHRKRHVHKMYQRFCRKFESGIKLPSAVDFGKVAPFIDFNMDDNGGQLESFDFDSFLHVDDENTQFPLDGFRFSQGQRAVSQQTTNLDAIPSTQSSQYPPLVSHESVETVPSFDAQTPHYPPVPSGSAASDFPLDLSGQQQRPSLGQGQSALAQQTPEALSQTWAQIQRQAQSMAQQQAQAQHQQAQAQRHQAHWQHQQAHSQAAMQPMSGMIQSPPSPAMPMLNRPMLSPVSTSSPSMPIYSRPVIPAISQSSQSRVESSLHNQSPTLTADSTLLPQPPSPNTVLRDYQYQLMFLDCRRRRNNPPPGQGQDGNSQLMTRDNEITIPSALHTTHTQGDTHEQGKHRTSNKLSDKVSGRVGFSPDVSRKQAIQEPDTSSFIDGCSDLDDKETGIYPKKPGRKPPLTAEQQRNADRMREVGPCYNCESLDIKVPYVQLAFPLHTDQRQCDDDSPCASCIKRKAEKKQLPSGICREINIANNGIGGTGQANIEQSPISGFLRQPNSSANVRPRPRAPNHLGMAGLMSSPISSVNLQHTGPLSGVHSAVAQTSGYVEPGVEDTLGKESLKPNVRGRGVLKRSHSRSDTGADLSWPAPAPLRFSPDDQTEQDVDQRSSRKRRRLAKEENGQFSKNTADIMSKLEDDEQMTETGNISISVDRDIVDVLLEEWTVPVY